jgi:16S rRNA (cytosine967-C5)-methyltransferase
MPKKINARIATVKVLLQLLKQQGSLASELAILNNVDEQEKRLAQEFCYGVCRWYFYLESQLNKFVSKPLKGKDSDIKLLILLGIYQLQFTRVAPHAAINETVNTALFFRKQWAKKLINGVLRSYQRSQEENTLIPSAKRSHPQWLQHAIERAWPKQAEQIFLANNQHPPFTLRVNRRCCSTATYLSDWYQQDSDSITAKKTPYSDVGITLEKAVDVTQLNGFAEGVISVQDEAAQLATPLLQLQPKQRVLDACCAPGGKTCHIGEEQADLSALQAVDLEARRLVRVRENIARLKIVAEIICGDGTDPAAWWDGQPFDRILLDAPCSATGVIRRHPDIKLLRDPAAIDILVQRQLQLLQALWPLLAEGGILLYATCSILPQENTQLIDTFIQTQKDAQHDVIIADWGVAQPYGRQLFPQDGGHDGFYYARLVKKNNATVPQNR